MATSSKVTFEVPPELRKIMNDHPEVNWSAVFRDALMRHAGVLDVAKRITDEETDRRIRALADSLKRGTGARYRKERDARRR